MFFASQAWAALRQGSVGRSSSPGRYVRSCRPNKGDGFRGFDTFGDDMHAEFTAERCDGADDRGVALVVRCAEGERLVDLYFPDRKGTKGLTEQRETPCRSRRSICVLRGRADGSGSRPVCSGSLMSCVSVISIVKMSEGHRCRTRARETWSTMSSSVRDPRREVDGERDVDARGVPLAPLASAWSRTRVVNPPMRPGVLGDRDELSGAIETVLGRGQRTRFDPGRRAEDEVHLRLVVQDQLEPVDGLMEVKSEREPPPRSDAGPLETSKVVCRAFAVRMAASAHRRRPAASVA